MIGQRFYLDKYKWSVVVLYNVNHNDVEFIQDNLSKICDNNQQIKDSTYYIEQQIPNTGFIFSNLDINIRLIPIRPSPSNKEFINTIVHEANHLQSHIATKYNIDEKGEEVCYLIGEIVERMYAVFKKIIL